MGFYKEWCARRYGARTSPFVACIRRGGQRGTTDVFRRVYQKETVQAFGRTVAEQSPRVFVRGEGDDLYILFHQAVAKVDHSSYEITEIARTPLPIRAGGSFLNNRI